LIEKGRRKVDECIFDLQNQPKELFKQEYSHLISVDAIESIIREHYTDKKDAQQYAAGYLLEQLQSKLELIIKDRSNILKEEINKFLETYEEVFVKLPKLNLGSVSIPFDPKGAFIGGLAGVGGVGALAVWAASLGNLGTYILVAKAVSLLSVLGISISGGVATAVAFVAAIGGPITLAVGLVAAAAAIGWALFGGSWQHSLAKQIVSHLEKQQVIDKFIQGVDEYWLNTAQAFDKGANAVEEQYQGYIQHLRELCSNDITSKQLIEDILHRLRELKDFFGGIPYRRYTG